MIGYNMRRQDRILIIDNRNISQQMKRYQVFIVSVCLFIVAAHSAFIQNRKIAMPAGVNKLLYSNDNKLLFVATSSTVSKYSSVTGNKLADFDLGGKVGITSLAVSATNEHIAIGFINGDLLILPTNNNQKQVRQNLKATSEITSICFTSDQNYIVYGVLDDLFYITNIATNDTHSFDFTNERVFAVACSPTDPTRFIVGGGELTLSKFSLYTFQPTGQITQVHDFPNQSGQTVRGATFSADGSKVYRSGSKGNIHVYDATTFQQIGSTFQVSQGTLYGIIVSKQSDFIATVNDTHAIIIDVNAQLLTYAIEAKPTTAKTTAMSSSGGNLIIISANAEAEILGQCIEGQYYNPESGCQVCETGCTLCIDSDNQCFACNEAHYLQDNTCLKCAYGCTQCLSLQKCDTCDKQKNFVKDTETNNCKCKQSYYDTLAESCEKCIPACLNCTNGATCDDCKPDGYIIVNGLCKCKPKTFEQKQELICINCQNGCYQCDESDFCILCDEQQNFNPVPNALGQCECKPKHFEQPETQTCQACFLGCFNCTEAATCIDCDVSSHFKEGHDVDSCQCEDYHYLAINQCILCSSVFSNCLTCDNPTTCTKCKGQLTVLQGKCGCESKKFVNSTFQCEDCSDNCLACQNSKTCSACQDGFSVDDEGVCQKDGLQPLIIVLIVVGAVAVVGAAVVVFKCIKKKKSGLDYEQL